jgi:hypothetical protein
MPGIEGQAEYLGVGVDLQGSVSDARDDEQGNLGSAGS